MDIIKWRTDPLSFKTAEFVKRNFNKIRSALAHLVYEMKKVKRGFSRLIQDVKYALGVGKKTINYKYRKEEYLENVKVRQVK